MKVKVVSFYTPGGYAEEAERLRASCGEFMVDAELVRQDRFSSWSDAVCYKPTFIRMALDRHEGYDGVLWTDADSAFRRPPDFSRFKDCDASWHLFKRNKRTGPEHLTGTMFFRQSETVRRFLEAWIVESSKHSCRDTPEQDALTVLWNQGVALKLRHMDIGPEWVWIYDDFRAIYGLREITIEHYQASRRLRRKA